MVTLECVSPCRERRTQVEGERLIDLKKKKEAATSLRNLGLKLLTRTAQMGNVFLLKELFGIRSQGSNLKCILTNKKVLSLSGGT